ncbi:MAG: preprotein translocase subunit SecE [Planctomycetota bacterium]
MGPFDIYKPNQGKYTRRGTLVGAMILVLAGMWWLKGILGQTQPVIEFLLPVAIGLAAAYWVFTIVYRSSRADFLIATEGEMKKVAWSNRREVMGSTKVVVFATFILAAMLYVVDIVFQRFFLAVDVLRAAQ